MSKLDKIVIKGFKSIKEAEIPLTNLNVLIGGNGSGKSNFISLFKLLSAMIENNLKPYVAKCGGAETFMYYGSKITELIFINLYFDQENYYAFHLEPNELNNFYDDIFDASYAKTESFRKRHKKPESYTYESLKNLRVYHFHDTSDTALVKRTHYINDCEFLRQDASNIAAYLNLLQKKYPDNYRRIVDIIQLVFPIFEDFHLRPVPENELNIILEYREKGFDETKHASMMSDGTLRFICLATVLLQPKAPDTIIIDEPELGLHPYALKVLASLIKKAAFDSQVIISTQSVELLSEFKPEDVITVDRILDEDNKYMSVFKRHNYEELKDWIDQYEYSLGDLWLKNVIGGRS